MKKREYINAQSVKNKIHKEKTKHAEIERRKEKV
jgi:hypothetical protein